MTREELIEQIRRLPRGCGVYLLDHTARWPLIQEIGAIGPGPIIAPREAGAARGMDEVEDSMTREELLHKISALPPGCEVRILAQEGGVVRLYEVADVDEYVPSTPDGEDLPPIGYIERGAVIEELR